MFILQSTHDAVVKNLRENIEILDRLATQRQADKLAAERERDSIKAQLAIYEKFVPHLPTGLAESVGEASPASKLQSELDSVIQQIKLVEDSTPIRMGDHAKKRLDLARLRREKEAIIGKLERVNGGDVGVQSVSVEVR